jgi:hypothetical protein
MALKRQLECRSRAGIEIKKEYSITSRNPAYQAFHQTPFTVKETAPGHAHIITSKRAMQD